MGHMCGRGPRGGVKRRANETTWGLYNDYRRIFYPQKEKNYSTPPNYTENLKYMSENILFHKQKLVRICMSDVSL